MTKFMIATIFFAFSIHGQAADGHEPKEGPCRKVMAACKSADFAKGDHKAKKGLFKNCMQPLLAGAPVAGVNVDPATINACRKIKDSRGKRP